MTTWQQVLERDDLVGGDVEFHESGILYRGPIESITLENGRVTFKLLWAAQLSLDFVWEKRRAVECFVDAEMSPPGDIGDGRIFFAIPLLGHGTIFPKGGNKLDPAKVSGLEPGTG